ncbi:SUZ domain-containing protein 1-like [Rhopilema esculentum]|uniref:SUZ domain-containing protein 1-like n=1 Tax=Rhopilema esculentum TaxID=499914 RepID=UPI0031D715E5
MDDDVLDSWEDAADTGELEKRMEQREKELRVKEEVEKNQELKGLAVGALAPAEELGRSEYVPQIRILKRENGPTLQNVKQVDKKPLKTLAEKEAEYAAARARILGSYSNAPPEQETKRVILTNDTSVAGGGNKTFNYDEFPGDEYKR